MRKFLKKMYPWFQDFLLSIISLFDVILSSKKVKLFRAAKVESKTIHILGNGPSLKGVIKNRESILTGDLMVLNFFPNTEYFWLLKPMYFIVLDPLFSDLEAINSQEKFRLLFHNLNKVDWNLNFFIPADGNTLDIIKSLVNNDKINYITYNTTRIIGFKSFRNFFYKDGYGIPSSKNVLIAALIIAINAGYKKIYLYGAEFSWTKTLNVNPENNRLFIDDVHFYKKSDIIYYDKGAYKWWLNSVISMLDGIEKAAEYAIYRDVKVINRTPGSFIDAFEYQKPETYE